MGRPVDGLRFFGQFYALLVHYVAFFVEDPDKALTEPPVRPVPLIYSFQTLILYFLILNFILIGISSGKWLTKHLNESPHTLRVIAKFYWQRLAMIIPMTYIYYLIFSMANWFVFKDPIISQKIWDSLWPNLFFVSNLVSIETNVSIINLVLLMYKQRTRKIALKLIYK